MNLDNGLFADIGAAIENLTIDISAQELYYEPMDMPDGGFNCRQQYDN
ncbi:MAG: hypothetical protein LBV04_00495 [Deferribacteraceae bacterium]|jgi:hypothetical protein|nr:hypothetical protein [Deferribacteraceae bacterium]